MLPSNRDTTATGPMAISLELPMKAYIKGGTKLLSAITEKVKLPMQVLELVLSNSIFIRLLLKSRSEVFVEENFLTYTARTGDPNLQGLNIQYPAM